MIHDQPPSCQVGVVKVFLNGASGRMGQRIQTVARDARHGCEVVARRARGDSSACPHADFDVVIDFSSDDGARESLEVALQARKGVLIGTTALSTATREGLRSASIDIPVMVAPNSSLAVAVVSALVAEAAGLLGADYTASISETHHTRKADRPSGTALMLADAISLGGASPVPREAIESIRTGDVVGDHEVRFTGPFDEVTIRHHAANRDLFAVGALRLARWLHRREPGLYSLGDWFQTRREGFG